MSNPALRSVTLLVSLFVTALALLAPDARPFLILPVLLQVGLLLTGHQKAA